VNICMQELPKEKTNSTYSFSDVALNSRLDFRVWVALTRARDLVIKARDSELAGHGISAVETQVMFLVHDAPESPTPAELCRWVLRAHNTVTALLRRMERKGLIAMSRDADKQNQWRVTLTELGEQEWKWAMEINAIHSAMSGVSPAEKKALQNTLSKIGDNALAFVTDDSSPPS
jgi:DNA-binding MarR family transcriptional regulator